MSKSAISTEQKQLILTLLVFLGGGFIGWRAIIASDLEAHNKLLAAGQDEIKKQALMVEIKELENQNVAFTREKFLDTSEVSWLVKAINAIAKDSGVVISSVTPLETERGKDYQKLMLKIETQCSYHALGDFVSKIESYPKLIKLSAINLRPRTVNSLGSSQSAGGLLDVSISVSAFHAN